MTNEPIAFAAVAADGSESAYVTRLKKQAEPTIYETMRPPSDAMSTIARLSLTDNERAVIRECAKMLARTRKKTVLLALLERTATCDSE